MSAKCVLIQNDVCGGAENLAVYASGDTDIPHFMYIPCNIPGPGCDVSLFEDKLVGCTCDTRTTCSMSHDTRCSCISRFGPAFDGVACLLPEAFTNPVLECNSECTCPVSCRNRVTQHGLKFQMEVFWDDKKGFGLRTREKIPRNRFVCEYAGEVLSPEEAVKRSKELKSSEMNYLFVLNEHTSSGVHKTYVDPSRRGNIGRFLNHSCGPNLAMVPVRVDTSVPKLCLFSVRDIALGEELTYDYGGLRGQTSSAEGPGKQETEVENKHDLKPCFCNCPGCRGYLPFDVLLFST